MPLRFGTSSCPFHQHLGRALTNSHSLNSSSGRGSLRKRATGGQSARIHGCWYVHVCSAWRASEPDSVLQFLDFTKEIDSSFKAHDFDGACIRPLRYTRLPAHHHHAPLQPPGQARLTSLSCGQRLSSATRPWTRAEMRHVALARRRYMEVWCSGNRCTGCRVGKGRSSTPMRALSSLAGIEPLGHRLFDRSV